MTNVLRMDVTEHNFTKPFAARWQRIAWQLLISKCRQHCFVLYVISLRCGQAGILYWFLDIDCCQPESTGVGVKSQCVCVSVCSLLPICAVVIVTCCMLLCLYKSNKSHRPIWSVIVNHKPLKKKKTIFQRISELVWQISVWLFFSCCSTTHQAMGVTKGSP
jgi:hypothetical protein